MYGGEDIAVTTSPHGRRAGGQRVAQHRAYGVVAASGDKMLLDTLATIILIGMMFVPFINIIAGTIVGAGLGGPNGACVGFALAVLIIAAERYLFAWFPLDGGEAPAARLQSNFVEASRAARLPFRRPVGAERPLFVRSVRRRTIGARLVGQQTAGIQGSESRLLLNRRK